MVIVVSSFVSTVITISATHAPVTSLMSSSDDLRLDKKRGVAFVKLMTKVSPFAAVNHTWEISPICGRNAQASWTFVCRNTSRTKVPA